MTIVRVYGHGLGHASFTQVTRGMELGLRTRHLHAGTLPFDGLYDDQAEYPGGLAPISLSCGSPNQLLLTHSMGMHQERWFLLAPNSDRIPAALATFLTSQVGHRRMIDRLVSPSAWGADVLRRWVDLPVLVAPHGVFPEFQVKPDARSAARASYNQGMFDVLHLSSTASNRKGTHQLLQAWQMALAEKAIPDSSCLYLVLMDHTLGPLGAYVQELGLAKHVVLATSAHGRSPTEMAALYGDAHLVVAPSRAEGFGLCVVEARACGVPVAATFCTGHNQHLADAEHGVGVVRIPHGPDAAIDDMPGANAPTVSPDAILFALKDAFQRWAELDEQARHRAPWVSSRWSWEHAPFELGGHPSLTSVMRTIAPETDSCLSAYHAAPEWRPR